MNKGKGEGSIYKETQSGLWAATIECGRGPNGKRKRHTVRAKTKAEVLRKIQKQDFDRSFRRMGSRR